MYRQAGSQNAEGGFFADNSMYSPSVNADRKKDVVRKQQSIASATVQQLMNCPGDTLNIGGHEITLVKILAKVNNIKVTSIKTEYCLEDDTGIIMGTSWRDGESNDENEETSPVVENSFCQVVGSLRDADNKKSLLVLHIAPVTDPNLLTKHLLSIAHTRLLAQKGSSAPNSQTNGLAAGSTEGATYSGSNSGNPNENILQYISTVGADTEAGISKQQVINQFSGQYSNKKIDEVLNFLCGEGQLYTTVDDDHFKSTE